MLMMVALVLVMMMAAQFALSNALVTRETEVNELAVRLQKLTDALNIERGTSDSLRGKKKELEDQISRTNNEIALAQKNLLEAQGKVGGIEKERDTARQDLARVTQEASTMKVQLSDLFARVEELNKKLALLTADLATAKTSIADKEIKIADLDKKLKKKMLQKVEELSEYRSEFFGKLKKALGNRPDIKIVGDRFVFQSEVFFLSASADLEESGKVELVKLAETLKEITSTIPKDINWMVSIIGHTDKRPINSPQFRSNWELSAARAISVVKFLVESGIPPERLSATGYGEYQQIDPGNDEAALSRNRRIEIKFNQR